MDLFSIKRRRLVLAILSMKFINLNLQANYHLGRYEPSSPSSKRLLACVKSKISFYCRMLQNLTQRWQHTNIWEQIIKKKTIIMEQKNSTEFEESMRHFYEVRKKWSIVEGSCRTLK